MLAILYCNRWQRTATCYCLFWNQCLYSVHRDASTFDEENCKRILALHIPNQHIPLHQIPTLLRQSAIIHRFPHEQFLPILGYNIVDKTKYSSNTICKRS